VKDVALLLAGTILGFVAGLLSWYLIYRGFKPAIQISPQVSIIPKAESVGLYRYRIKLRNGGAPNHC
jgi:hypothetical protein